MRVSPAGNWNGWANMLKKLAYWYRALGTGFCFAGFGLGCVVVGITVLPVVLFWPGNAAARRRRVRYLVSLAFRVLLAAIRGLGLGRVEVEGREWLKHASGRLVLATHPNYLDAVVLLSLLPMADCVIKSGLWRNPFTRAFVIAADYISNEDPVGVIETCIRAVHNGEILVLFPEVPARLPENNCASSVVRHRSRCAGISKSCRLSCIVRRPRCSRLPSGIKCRSAPGCYA